MVNMGTFSSKKRSSDSNGSGGRHFKSGKKTENGMEESSNLSTRAGATTHEDNSKVGNSSEKLPRRPKAVQSFGWLMETTVAQHSTSKEPKVFAKPPSQARKSKCTSVLAYSNGKYLKSAELVYSTSSTASKHKVEPLLEGTSSQSSSQSKCFVEKRSNKTESEQKNVNENTEMNSRPQVAYAVGFGAIGKSDSLGKAHQEESEVNGCREDESKAVKVKGKYPTAAKGGKHPRKRCEKNKLDC